MVRRLGALLHKVAKSVGIRRHDHEHHPMTLRRLILFSCLFSISVVAVSSWMFYRDSRSKYDLVRPGRRELPQSFRAEDDASSVESKDDVKLEIQRLRGQLNSLDTYGNFNNDSLSDAKVLQSYLDQPVLEQ